MMTNVTFVRIWFLVLLLGSAGFAQAQDRPEESEQRDQIHRLVEELGDDSLEVRQAAGDKLIEIGDPALPAVRKAVDSSDPEVSHRARTILGVVEMKSRLGLSDKVLQSIPDIYLRLAGGTSGADAYALFAEVTMVDGESEKPLHEFEPADAGKLAGLMAARGFSGMGDDEKKDFLLRCKGEVCSPSGRRYSSTDLHLSATAPYLVPLLKDENTVVRRVAAEALGSLGAKEYALRLVPLLKDGNTGVRWATVEALGKLGAKEVAPDLVSLLKDGDAEVRSAIARAFGSLGAKEYAPRLVPLLKDGNTGVRWATVEALGKLGAKEAAPDLVPLLKDGDEWVRILAAIVLVELGKADIVAAAPDVIEEIKRAAEEKEYYPEEMRARAARALEKLGAKREEPK